MEVNSKKIQECGVLNYMCWKCVCGTGMYHMQIHQMLVLYFMFLLHSILCFMHICPVQFHIYNCSSTYVYSVF